MNEKANILDAWIAVEQFSEGDIRPIDKNYKNIDEKKIYSNSDFDWKSYFLDEMNAFIKKENICQEKQGEVSLIMYFGIFDFSEVITIFKNIYKIKDTNEELKNGAKFTLSLSFDRNLNFISDKLFLTMSGYIREKKDIPKNLYDIENNLNETFVSNKASTQTLMDRASKYGFQKNKEEWIGIPLWVHRRSNYPMFSISNTIAYNGLMVQGKNHEKAKGRAVWYDVKGIAIDKYVEEQGNKLVDLIKNKLLENQDLKNQIYVITPFKNIVNRLISKLSEIDFVITDENKKPANVGTVHTFQGKEAKIVYFVLGADTNSKGAARWAFSDPNIVNVAATRAKEEFYIIGDKTLYSELGSTIASLTINIIDNYNDKKNEDCKLWELSNIKNKTEFTQ